MEIIKVSIVFFIFFHFIYSYFLYKIAQKHNYKDIFVSFIPFYNQYVLFKLIGNSFYNKYLLSLIINLFALSNFIILYSFKITVINLSLIIIFIISAIYCTIVNLHMEVKLFLKYNVNIFALFFVEILFFIPVIFMVKIIIVYFIYKMEISK